MEAGIPFSVFDILMGLIVGVALLFVGIAVTRGSNEKKTYLTALVVKILACVVYNAIYFYVYDNEGDSLDRYHPEGIEYADEIRSDLPAGNLAGLALEEFLFIGGSSTSRMVTLSGWLHYSLFDSLLASSLVFAALGLAGQILVYRVFVAYLPHSRLRRLWQIGILFFPTLVFWSSGMLKDSLGIFGLGCMLKGTVSLLETRETKGAMLAGLGMYVLLLFRIQLAAVLLVSLIPLTFQGGAEAARGSAAPLAQLAQRVAVIVVCVAGVILVQKIQPDYSVMDLPGRVSALSRSYENYKHEGEIRDEGGWGGIVLGAPYALLFALYRPFPWEASGALQLFSALENLAIAAWSLRMLVCAIAKPAIVASSLRSPLFITSVLFCVGYAIVVGLSTPNLGTVSRYRIPLIPFLAGILVIVEFHWQCVTAPRNVHGTPTPLSPGRLAAR